MLVVSIWRQEPSYEVAGCTSLEVVGGQKAYLRIFDGTDHIEWGWNLHESATCIWTSEREDADQLL